MTFLADNIELLWSDSKVPDVNTRNRHDIYRPIGSLTVCQKDVYSTVIKLYM